MYIQKESVGGILIKIKVYFLISKDFIMYMDKFTTNTCDSTIEGLSALIHSLFSRSAT